jgi:hypothetical protein
MNHFFLVLGHTVDSQSTDNDIIVWHLLFKITLFQLIKIHLEGNRQAPRTSIPGTECLVFLRARNISFFTI